MNLLHPLTHRHATLTKAGVGRVVLCRRRWPHAPWCTHVQVDGARRWHHIDGVDGLGRLLDADTAAELRAALTG